MHPARSILIWAAVAALVLVPLAYAAASPLLQWRQPVYIGAGFAGVIAMALLLFQPLLAAGRLPGLSGLAGRRVHRWVGAALVLAVVLHVAGLWITSPPDVVDALLFRSPTPFSAFGVTAMWAVFAAALLAAWRTRLKLRPRSFRRAHTGLALVVVFGSIIHAVLIEGTMETVTKVLLCAAVLAATVKVVVDLKVWASSRR